MEPIIEIGDLVTLHILLEIGDPFSVYLIDEVEMC